MDGCQAKLLAQNKHAAAVAAAMLVGQLCRDVDMPISLRHMHRLLELLQAE